jgi:hypothetical protein
LLSKNLGVTRTLSIRPFLEKTSAPTRKKERSWRPSVASHQSLKLQYFAVFASVTLVTLGAFVFTPIVGAHATALVYLLTVVNQAAGGAVFTVRLPLRRNAVGTDPSLKGHPA